MKSGPGTRLRVNPELAAIAFYQGAADCQPHANTVWFRREEGLKYPVHVFRPDAGTVILQGQMSNILILLGAHRHGQGRKRHTGLLHGLDTVAQ